MWVVHDRPFHVPVATVQTEAEAHTKDSVLRIVIGPEEPVEHCSDCFSCLLTLFIVVNAILLLATAGKARKGLLN